MKSKFLLPAMAVALGSVAALSPHLSACTTGATHATAYQAKSRDELVGGPRALGDIGDYVLANGRIRAVIQGAGASRGFGVFGGSLVDLDLERPRPSADGNPKGADGVSEIFPAFFLRGLEPSSVTIKADGSDGGPAIISVKGEGAEFLTEVKLVNDLFLGTGFKYEIEYILEPFDPNDPDSEYKSRSLLLRVTATNASDKEINLPTASFPVGFGLVVLLGEGQKLFMPGNVGYDLRFALEDSYKNAPPLPNLPGVTARALASTGEHVSYALAPESSGRNFVYTHRAAYPDAKDVATTKDYLVIPFVAASFAGAFFHDPPSVLAPGKSTTYSTRIYVGTGDIASALDLAMQARHDEYGSFHATVREEGSGVPLEGITVSLLAPVPDKCPIDAPDFATCAAPITSARSQKEGEVKALAPPGTYRAAVVASNRPTVLSAPFVIESAQTHHQELTIGRNGWLSATVLDQSGRPIPAKVSIIGTYAPEHAKEHPRKFLYNLKVGEPLLMTDIASGGENYSDTREYLERVLLTDASGLAEGDLKPGTYKVVASRGPEYTIVSQTVTLEPGGAKHLGFVLNRVVDTSGYVAGDFHVHTNHSIDSGISLEDRARTYAAEGIEFLATTDHNFVTDLTPSIDRAGLGDFVHSCVGLELTTLELGHFNGFPLDYTPGAITRGSFDWFRHPAGELFARLRENGALAPERTVVEVNHPRDTIMGYFNAFKLDKAAMPQQRTDMTKPQGPEFELSAWSEDFDAMEIYNGKRLDLIKTYRVPDPLPPPPLPTNIAQMKTGDIVVDSDGYPAFPGNFEDWLAFLKRGKVVTGMGNSDSHFQIDGEAGYARSLVKVAHKPEVARDIDQGEIADAIHHQQVLITDGPVPELFVNGQPVGSLVSAPGGQVSIEVKVQAAPWMDVSRVTLLVVNKDTDLWARPDDERAIQRIALPFTTDGAVLRSTATLNHTLGSDSMLLLEVEGQKSMWPVVVANEIASLMINDAVKVIGGSFGLGDDGFGNLRPSQVHPVTPYALTNPIWVDVDGDGVCMGKKTVGTTQSPLDLYSRPAPKLLPTKPVDLMRLLRQFDH